MKKIHSKFTFLLISVLTLFMSLSANSAGTNVSSGLSITTGTSHTHVYEWGDYKSHGNGIALSVVHNAHGFDSRAEKYKTYTNTHSETKGTVDGSYTSLGYSSSAGILDSSTGVTKGTSISNLENKSWGRTETNGRYRQLSVQNDSYNYEQGRFQDTSGYVSNSYTDSVTLYVSNYSSTEFNR